jgi:hypothetical protein
MATKTWKLGESSQGSVITVETTTKVVKVIGKEWDMLQGTMKGSNQSGAKEFTRREYNIDNNHSARNIDEFLHTLTTSYYAGQIMDWIKTKVKFPQNYIW